MLTSLLLAAPSPQTYYAHLLCQFPTDDDTTVELDITEEVLAAKNEKVRASLTEAVAAHCVRPPPPHGWDGVGSGLLVEVHSTLFTSVSPYPQGTSRELTRACANAVGPCSFSAVVLNDVPLSFPFQNGGKLSVEMSGPMHEVFAKVLRGLSGARITRPGHFKNAAGDGVSVRCSYKADDGQVRRGVGGRGSGVPPRYLLVYSSAAAGVVAVHAALVCM